MKKKQFLASMTKVTFVLAVILMGFAFTGCSKDNQDDENTNVVVINGKSRPITKAYLVTKEGTYNYQVQLYLSKDEMVSIYGNAKIHNNKTIDLTKNEIRHEEDYWGVSYDGKKQIYFYTRGNNTKCTKGTMNSNVYIGSTEADITVKDMELIGNEPDFMPYSVSLHFKGKLDVRESEIISE